MAIGDNDPGVIQALLERMTTQRLPRAMELKAKVDRGDCLENFEVDYLAQVLADVRAVKALVDRHPEYEELVIKGMDLYKEISTKAIANEQGS